MIPDIVCNIVYDIVLDIALLMFLHLQDCVCLAAPYLFRIEPVEDFDPIGNLILRTGVIMIMT